MLPNNNPQSKPQHLGVCALVFNAAGQILVGKRKNSYKAGWYGLPGGRLEVNEPLEFAMQRELTEETGMTAVTLQYLGVVKENQGTYDFIHFVYVTTVTAEVPQLCEPEKCEGWEWVAVDEVENLLEGHQGAIDLYRKQIPLVDLVR